MEDLPNYDDNDDTLFRRMDDDCPFCGQSGYYGLCHNCGWPH